MASLFIHLETLFDDPDLVVMHTSTTSHEAPVVMLVRLDKLSDTVVTMLDALDLDDAYTDKKRVPKGSRT
jgi:hypothetical protein